MRIKYIADGFMQDANMLLKDFIVFESLDFKTFCYLWKKYSFFYIYFGRCDIKEFREFVNEIYHLLLSQMMMSGIEYQIGGMYLLYALYRNQNAISPIKIRVTQTEFGIFKCVQIYAEQKQIPSLQYVIEFLSENCLEYVAFTTLYGPCRPSTKIDYIKPKSNECNVLATVKYDMIAFHESNVLEDLKNLHTQYLERSKCFQPQKIIPSDIIEDYDKFEKCLVSLVGEKKQTQSKNVSEGIGSQRSGGLRSQRSGGIGSRRSELKKISFQRKAKFRCLNSDEDFGGLSNEVLSPRKMAKREKRVPPQKRRLGRPRKKTNGTTSSEESESEKKIYIKKYIYDSKKVSCKRRGRNVRKRESYLKSYDGPIPLKTTKQETKLDDLSDTSTGSSGDLRF